MPSVRAVLVMAWVLRSQLMVGLLVSGSVLVVTVRNGLILWPMMTATRLSTSLGFVVAAAEPVTDFGEQRFGFGERAFSSVGD